MRPLPDPAWIVGEVSEWIPDNVVSTTAGGLVIVLIVRLFMYLKKDVLDEQSRRLVEAGKERRKMQSRIDDRDRRIEELEKIVRANEQRIWVLEQAAARIQPPPDDSGR